MHRQKSPDETGPSGLRWLLHSLDAQVASGMGIVFDSRRGVMQAALAPALDDAAHRFEQFTRGEWKLV